MVNSFFSFADGTAKCSGRDFEFRVPTLRRYQPVRSENLSGEIQGESEESQPESAWNFTLVSRVFLFSA